MPNLHEIRLTPLFDLNWQSISSRAFRQSIDSVEREHASSHPCRQLRSHLSRPNSTAWSHRMPLLVLATAQQGLLGRLHIRRAVFEAWCRGGAYPEAILGRDTWIALFREAGFSRDGYAASRPLMQLTLYRGCWHQFCKGLSWTSNWNRAIEHAGDGYSDLYIARPRPEAVLAHITARGDDEWIVDTTRISVERVAP